MLQVLFPVGDAVGVVGVAQADHSGPGGDVAFQVRQIDPAVSQLGGEEDHLSPGSQAGLPEQVVHGIEDDHFVSGGKHRPGNDIHAPGRAVNGQDQLGIDDLPLACLQPIGNGLLEFRQTQLRGVGKISAVDVIDHGLTDGLCHGKVRICCRQGDDTVVYFGPAVIVGPLLQHIQPNVAVVKQSHLSPP